MTRGINGTLILSVGAIGNLGNTVAGGGERFLITAIAAPVTLVNTLVSGVVAQDRGNSNARFPRRIRFCLRQKTTPSADRRLP